MSGLLDLAPPGWLDRIARSSKTSVLLRVDGADVVARVEAAGADELRIPRRDFNIGALLSSLGLQRGELSLGLLLDCDFFFVRDINIPAVAVTALPKILDQEIIHRTPFQLSEIWHSASCLNEREEGIPRYRHWILSKARTRAALDEISCDAGDLDFFATTAGGQILKVMPLATSPAQDPAWISIARKILCTASAAIFILGLLMLEWRQSSIAGDLEASLDAARRELAGQAAGDPAAQLAVLRSQPSLLQIWDELSRVLPDHTFLTEFRYIDGGRVSISGCSGDAARLVRTIDGSPLFTGAALGEAITPDPAEQKDRFSISFRLRRRLAGGVTNASMSR